jgi:hypothetical protein
VSSNSATAAQRISTTDEHGSKRQGTFTKPSPPVLDTPCTTENAGLLLQKVEIKKAALNASANFKK